MCKRIEIQETRETTLFFYSQALSLHVVNVVWAVYHVNVQNALKKMSMKCICYRLQYVLDISKMWPNAQNDMLCVNQLFYTSGWLHGLHAQMVLAPPYNATGPSLFTFF